jgi:peptidoglycan/LPS O-acetylase OafA/YrhL
MSAAATRPHVPALDYLRLFAIVLVTLQHALSVLGRYDLTQVHGVSVGQLGVAIFCAISGYLAFSGGGDDPARWLLKRLRQLFPAYWLAMLFSFLVTWLFHVKAITPGLFLSQMLGLGFFTHGWALVNIVSWFISLILLCYLIAAIAKASRHPTAVLALASLVAWGLVFLHWEVDLSRHVLAFTLAGLLRLEQPRAWLVAAGSLPLLACPPWPQFTYAVFALLLLAALPVWRVSAGRAVRGVADHVYEYFLLHGMFIAGGIRLLPASPVLGVALGIGASLVGAFALKQLLARMRNLMPAPANPIG